MAVYGIAAPVVPFRLRELGYDDVEELTGWLVAGEQISYSVMDTPTEAVKSSLRSWSHYLVTADRLLWRADQEPSDTATAMYVHKGPFDLCPLADGLYSTNLYGRLSGHVYAVHHFPLATSLAYPARYLWHGYLHVRHGSSRGLCP